MPEAVRLMRETFAALRAGTAQNHPRRRLHVASGAVLHSLAGSIGAYFGTKVYSTHAKHGAHFHFLLYEAGTGRPLALMEANHLGQIRTGAASGYAVDVLARPEASTLGVIGSGFQARTQVEAVACVRRLARVHVWSRSQEKRERFAAACAAELGLDARPVDTAEEAVRGMDMVTTATFAKDPVLEDAWIGDGVLVNAMGSNQPARRELPAELVKRSRVWVDALDVARIESGDLLLAFDDADWARVRELKDAGPGNIWNPEGVTVFKSNGLGVEDVAAGGFVYEQFLAVR